MYPLAFFFFLTFRTEASCDGHTASSIFIEETTDVVLWGKIRKKKELETAASRIDLEV